MKWTSSSVPDQTGKTVLVTGANSGIGKETAKQLAAKGAKVVIAVRTTEKGHGAKSEIQAQHPDAQLEVMELDLASLASIEKFANIFKSKHNKLDILVNNAGVMVPPYSKTEDGFEMQMGTNHFGHFALTLRLLPLIKNTAGSRVVTVSSVAHTSGDINFDDIHWEKRDYDKWQAYGDSKIANLYFTYELARKLKDLDVKVVAAHPGLTATNLQKNTGFFTFLTPLLGQRPAIGALPTLRAAVDPRVDSGDYYGPRGFKGIRGYPVKVESNQKSHDTTTGVKLWELSVDLTGVAE